MCLFVLVVIWFEVGFDVALFVCFNGRCLKLDWVIWVLIFNSVVLFTLLFCVG